MTFKDTTFYTVDEIAKRLKAHIPTIQKHIREGRLAAVKIGKSYRISEEALDDYLKALSTVGNAEATELLKEAREAGEGER